MNIKYRTFFGPFVAALALSSCGGGDAAPPTMAPTPAPVVMPSPAPDPFAPVQAAIDDYNDTDFTVIVGTGAGEIFTYTKGAFELGEARSIASASKWLTAATI